MSDFGDWGFQGKGKRGLDLPVGDDVEVGPSGRARMRFVQATGRLQVSVDGGPYVDVTTSVATIPALPSLIGDLFAYIDPTIEPDGDWSETVDSVGNTYATVTSGALPSVQDGIATFDGDSYFQYSSFDGTDLGTEFTFFFRVNPATTSESLGGNVGTAPRLYAVTDSFSYDTNLTITWTGVTGWQTLVMGYDGADVFARRDGVEVARATIAAPVFNSQPIRFARTGTGTNLEGQAAAFGLYRRALNLAEIKTLEEYLTGLAA